MIKIYQKYLIQKFITIFFMTFFIFSILGFIMGIIQELKFFSELNVNFYFPIMLVLLDLPSLLFQIIPFIIILTVIFLFLKLEENGELITFKNNGLNNFKVLNILSSTSLIIGILMVIIFYNLSAILKFNYLNIKQNYTNDGKYLASITENGLWIKDQINDKVTFINAKKIENNYLLNVDILQLDENFDYLNSIFVDKVNIKNEMWILEKPLIVKKDNSTNSLDEMRILTNFNYQKINNLYSDLNSLTLWGLIDLKNDYKDVNYSTTEIDYQIQRVAAFPIYLAIMSILSITMMMNINRNSSKFFIITLGVFLSVIIYYMFDFFGIIGKNEKIPLILSIWGPLSILIIISIIGLIKIDEK